MQKKSYLRVILGVAVVTAVFIGLNTFYSGSDGLKGEVHSTTSSATPKTPPTVSLSAPGIVKFAGATSDVTAVATGDINGDGYDDMAIGAALDSVDGEKYAGTVYVIYGKTSVLSIDLSNPNLVTFTGETNSKAGASLTMADLNGDSYDDIIIGASYNPGGDYEGGVYVVYGSGTKLSSASLSTAVKITGTVHSGAAGTSVAAGDLNGDGYDDMVIGSPYANTAYVVYGNNTKLASGTLSTAVAITGETSGDYAGQSVSTGDLNSDGYDDLIVGSPRNSDSGSSAGAAYVVYGSSTTLSTANLSSAVELTGEAAKDYAGQSISTGDLNGDGYDDLIVGAYQNDDGGQDAGAAYVVYGSSTTLSTANLSSAVELTGEAKNDYAGGVASSLSTGDLNGDGYDELIVGAYKNDDGGTDAGAVYIIRGFNKMLTSASFSVSGELTGEAAGDTAGSAVTSGDLSGDGKDEMIITAPYNSSSDGGAVYVVVGR